MPVTSPIQNSFTAGELDPKLRARSDIATYYTGAQKIRNALIGPQGFVTRRPGLEYMATLDLGNMKMVEFEYSALDHYIIILTALKTTIYKGGVLQDTVVSSITEEQIPNITFAQSFDTLMVFHPEFSPVYFLRNSDTDWVTGTWLIKNPPTHNFGADTGVGIRIEKSAGNALDFQGWVPGSINIGTLFIADASYFTADMVGKFIRGPLGGYAEITSFTSDIQVLATVLAAFTNDFTSRAANLIADQWALEELTFSTEHGYPACGTFFQGRLWLAGTPAIPSGIWASMTNNEEDFQSWSPSLDDNGIEIVVRDSQTAFHHLHVGSHLMAFSSDGVFYIPKSDLEPVTPTNISVKKNSSAGGQNNLDPVKVGGSTVYMRLGGKSLLEDTFNFAAGNYLTQDLSLLSSHLLYNPVSMAYRKQTNTDESDYVLVVNSDGTLSVLCTLRTQEVTGWSVCTTDGDFKHVVVDGSEMYFAIDREYNSVTTRTLERFNYDLLLDDALYNPELNHDIHYISYMDEQVTYMGRDVSYGTTQVDGLDHLNGRQVSVVLDNTIQPDAVVMNGKIILERPGTVVNVGLNFPIVDEETGYRVHIQSMPLEIAGKWGSSVNRKKRVSEVVAMVYETSHIIVDSNRAIIRKIGVDHLDSPVPLKTENIVIGGILGWSDEVSIGIGQTLPLPMTLLGMTYRVRT